MSEDKMPGKGRILIVDDDENVRWFIANSCKPLGYDVLTADSGLEALKIIQEHQQLLDLVVLDLKMPGMGGIEVLKSIRKFQQNLPVIVLTALKEKRDECEALYIHGFVTKPYKLAELFRYISSIMEKQDFDRKGVEIDADKMPAARIMVVDDERDVCELLKLSLTEDITDCKFEVLAVNSGDEALRESVAFEPDLAIIDIKMPFMWGDELIKRFETGQGYRPKDYIIYTSITDPEEVQRTMLLGYKILPKPTEITGLVTVLKKLCIKHNLFKKKS